MVEKGKMSGQSVAVDLRATESDSRRIFKKGEAG